MNNKIFGIFICIMLMTSYIAVAENIKTTSTNFSSTKTSKILFDTNPPIWIVDNYWNFKIYDMTVDFEQESQYINVKLESNKLVLNVNDVTTDSYIVGIDADVSGSIDCLVDLGQGPINLSINFNNVQLSGIIIFNKSDLGIKQLNPRLQGRFFIKINEIPNFPIPIPDFPIPIKVTTDIFTNFSIPLTIIEFPLNISNIWGVPGTYFSIDGTIQSPWLNNINLINNLLRKPIPWFILTIILKIIANKINIDITQLEIISDILIDILPVINISYILKKYMKIGNVFETPEIPKIFLCEDLEEINIQNKIYNAYNISVIGGIGNIYYAPDAGNIVKIIGHFKDILPFISDLNIELKETNYQP